VIGAARMLVGAVLLAAAAAWRRPAASATGATRPTMRDAWRWVALGVCMAGFQVTYFTAVTRAGIAVTALVAICSAPIMIAALATGLLDERLTPRLLVALAFGVAGPPPLLAPPAVGGPPAPHPFSGVLLALAAGLGYALYVVTAKSAVARTPPLLLSAVTFAVAAVLTAPAFLAPGTARQLALAWPGMLYLGAVTTA